MKRSHACAVYSLLALALLALSSDVAQAEPPYTQKQDIIYAESDGIGLLMDVFTPTGKPNGLGIVDVASGAWFSDRGKINDHKRAQMFDIFCGRGYTVFAVRPGSRTKFTAQEMLANVKNGIRWVKLHKDEYKIDPDRLGLTGASAGGHLASLAAVTAEDGDERDNNPLFRNSTRVKAVAVFFPPTDFTNWGKIKVEPGKAGQVTKMIGGLLYTGGITNQSDEEVFDAVKAISPAHQVTGKAPPFLIYHGDADPLVPLQQSEIFVEACKKQGVAAELIVKPGGAHPWPTINEEVAKVADWFDQQLPEKPQTASAADANAGK